MSRLREFIRLYRIYRRINNPFNAARYAWIVACG